MGGGGASPDISRKELQLHSFAAREGKQTLPPIGKQEAVLVLGQTQSLVGLGSWRDRDSSSKWVNGRKKVYFVGLGDSDHSTQVSP